MIKSLTALSALTVATILPACATQTPSTMLPSEVSMAMTQITGQVAYRERIALRPGGSVAVTLEDVSIADRQSRILARDDIALGGQQVPIAFTLNVDPSELDPRGRYSVRAKIFDREGALQWTTDTAHMLNPTGQNQNMGLLNLVRVGSDNTRTTIGNYICADKNVTAAYSGDKALVTIDGKRYNLTRARSASGANYMSDGREYNVMFWSKGESAMLRLNDAQEVSCTMVATNKSDMMDIGLADKEWVAEDISRTGIIDSSRMTLNFDANGRLYGRSGCNSYTTDFKRDGMTLTIGNVASTRMACAPALMNQEQKFLDVLNDVESFTQDETGALIFKTADGRFILAR